MTVETVLRPCCHGRLRPHSWWNPHHPGYATVCRAAAPEGCRFLIRADASGEITIDLRWTSDPTVEVDICRCGGLIIELALGGWRHLDVVLEAGCLDTRPVEDP